MPIWDVSYISYDWIFSNFFLLLKGVYLILSCNAQDSLKSSFGYLTASYATVLCRAFLSIVWLCDWLHWWVYCADAKLIVLQRPQLVKGNMQLFSVDQQRSQALEAHAASFASFKVRWFFLGLFDYLLHKKWTSLVSVNIFAFLTGSWKWESIHSYLLCHEECQCRTDRIQITYYWAGCTARWCEWSFVFVTIQQAQMLLLLYFILLWWWIIWSYFHFRFDWMIVE